MFSPCTGFAFGSRLHPIPSAECHRGLIVILSETVFKQEIKFKSQSLDVINETGVMGKSRLRAGERLLTTGPPTSGPCTPGGDQVCGKSQPGCRKTGPHPLRGQHQRTTCPLLGQFEWWRPERQCLHLQHRWPPPLNPLHMDLEGPRVCRTGLCTWQLQTRSGHCCSL